MKGRGIRQSRIRNARREFARAFPDIAAKVEQASVRAQRRAGWSIAIRNVLIGAGFVAVLFWRCAQ